MFVADKVHENDAKLTTVHEKDTKLTSARKGC